jgi:hypothetical protein
MLSQRYWISGLTNTEKCVIWDSKIGKYLGNGKGEFLTLDTWAEAEGIVKIMAKRVGA